MEQRLIDYVNPGDVPDELPVWVTWPRLPLRFIKQTEEEMRIARQLVAVVSQMVYLGPTGDSTFSRDDPRPDIREVYWKGVKVIWPPLPPPPPAPKRSLPPDVVWI